MESTSQPLKIHISLATYTLLKKIGCYICEERGLTFIKGKGEMRTFWLKGEDKSKRIALKAKSKLDEWSGTPDLLCIDEIRLNEKGVFPGNYYSTKSLNNISSLSAGSVDMKNLENLPALQISKNFPSHDCYLCQKKKYLFQKYHAELRHRCEKFEGLMNYASSTSFSSDESHNECACIKKTHNELFPRRSPNSAPQIIFKE